MKRKKWGDMELKEKNNNWIELIQKEYKLANEKFAMFNSEHEGYAVLLEEVDELWDEIKNNSSKLVMAKEAIQVAAMVLKFLESCC